MSTLKADTVTTKSDNTDLTITGGGTGVPNLEAGFKVGGSAGVPTASIQADAVTTAKINDDAVTTAKINDDAVTTAKINNDAVTLAKLAAGTDGELITWDASGDPAAVAVGTATHVLTSNGAGAVPTFQAAAGGGAYTFISKVTASASSDLEFTTGFSSTYDTFLMVASNIIISDNNVDMRFEWGPTSGYLAGTDYRGAVQISANADSSGYSAYNWGGLAFNTIMRGVANSTGTISGFHIYITGREDLVKTIGYGPISYFGSSYRSEGGTILFYGQTNWQLDQIKFYMVSGTITSGNICLYGINTS